MGEFLRGALIFAAGVLVGVFIGGAAMKYDLTNNEENTGYITTPLTECLTTGCQPVYKILTVRKKTYTLLRKK